ncbi:hypothetical protein [Ferrovum sp.]|jgi:hypothetical protein|uniref:hypothetical protein n=1 Tax=Ferrovum sp. TaxID=2609467 RepID=UPI002639922D|nr:hypothetical protein [Ferrovum sp.]
MTKQKKSTPTITPAADPWNLLLHGPMSDEACAQIAEFLSELAFFFEGARFAQIRRYHNPTIPDTHHSDPEQLDLFTSQSTF